ncbi:MAG: AAA family ATPase [Phycisphaerae bacterium]
MNPQNEPVAYAPDMTRSVTLPGSGPFMDSAEPVANPLLVIHRLLTGRYHWAILLGLLLAIAGTVMAYKNVQLTYKSVGLVRILPYLPRILYTTSQNEAMPMFSAYINSQTALIESSRTIDLAMQNPKWQALHRGMDAAAKAKFASELTVTHKSGNELIYVAFTSRDPVVAQIGANAVIDAYRQLYSHGDSATQNLQINALRDRQTVLQNELQSDQDQIAALSSQYGADGLGTIYNYKLGLMNELDTQWQEARIALAKAGSGSGTATGKKGGEKVATAPLAPVYDPQIAQFELQALALKKSIKELELSGLGPNNQRIMTLQASLAALRDEIRSYQASLAGKGPAIAPTTPGGPVPLALLQAREHQLRILYESVKAQTLALGSLYAKVQNLQTQSRDLRRQLHTIKSRMDAINMESATGGRIRVESTGNFPAAATTKSRHLRLAAAAAAGLGGIVLGFGVILLWGFLHGSLRTVGDMQITPLHSYRILGAVPQLPSNGAATPLELAVGARSIHRIRGLLQVRPNMDSSQALVITSPTAGTGKTSMILALGISYAASEMKTLLIDADVVGGQLTDRMGILRSQRLGEVLVKHKMITHEQLKEALSAAAESKRPVGSELLKLRYIDQEMLDKALQLQRLSKRGLMDAVAGKPLDECVVHTKIRNLDVLPLGRAKAHHGARMSPASIRAMLARAKERYDVVLVDTGPVLGSLESALLASQADGVLMVVARGENRNLSGHAADYLASVGAHLEGVVFNRATERDMHRQSYSTSLSSFASAAPVADNALALQRDTERLKPLAPLGPLAVAVATSSTTQDEEEK